MCKTCRDGQCKELRKAESLLVTCPKCRDISEVFGGTAETCDRCKGFGRVPIEGCPMKLIPRAAWQTIRLAAWAQEGTWPVGGGYYDQAQYALIAFDIVWQAQAAVRDENAKKQ